MKRLTLQTLVSLLGIGSIVIFFLTLTGFTGWWLAHLLQQNLEQRALSLATALAAQSVEAAVTDDPYSLHRALQRGAAANPDVQYAFVVLRDGRVAGHTFDRGFPRQLLRLNEPTRGRSLRFRTRDDLLLDVRVPLLDGQLGWLHLGTSLAPVLAEQRRFLAGIGTVLLVLTAATLLVARQVGLLVSRPLRELAATARAVPAGAIVPEAIEVSGTAEVRELSLAFRDMVRDLRRLEAEQQAARARMVAAERLAALGELAAGLAHEILNPLDGVLECCRYLQRHLPGDDRLGKYVQLMDGGLERIYGVMRQMLVFARGSPVPVLGPCLVPAVVETVQSLVKHRTAKREIVFTVAVPTDLTVHGDQKSLEQALLNLILNAMDAVAGTESPAIHLSADVQAGWGRLHVDDNGPGVPPPLRDQIFTPFFSTKEPGKGTGLGLPISRQLVQQCGGDLQLAAQPGSLGGARFTILLPTDRRTPAGPPPAPETAA